MEEENVKTKKMSKKLKVTIGIVAALVIILGSANIYATTNGYGNIFFVIKNLVTTGTVTGEENLLSDKEITISYTPIDVINGVTIQVNKLVVEENKSTLYLFVNEENIEKGTNNTTPFTYKVSNNEKKEIANYTSNKKETDIRYTDTIELNGFKDETGMLYVDIYTKEGKSAVSLTINLQSKEIIVNGDYIVKKQSEVEMKQYLAIFSLLNCEDLERNTILVNDAIKINEMVENSDNTKADSREAVLKTIKSFYNGEVETNENGVVKLNNEAYSYYKVEDNYIRVTDGKYIPGALCLEINEIEYGDGTYKVTFTYCYPSVIDIKNGNVENLANYQAIAIIEANDNTEVSKYKLLSITKGTIIKDEQKQNEDEDEQKQDESNNNTTSNTIGNNAVIEPGESEIINNTVNNVVNNTTPGYTIITDRTKELLDDIKDFILDPKYTEKTKINIYKEQKGSQIGYLQNVPFFDNFLSEFDRHIINIDDSITYNEFEARDQNYIADEYYGVQINRYGYQSSISWDTKQSDIIYFMKHEEGNVVIYKITLNISAQEGFGKIYADAEEFLKWR